VDGDITFEGGCRAVGGLDLTGCEAASVRLDGSTVLDAPGQAALDLSGARLRASLICAPGLVAPAACASSARTWAAPSTCAARRGAAR
jgi:hypothetical protein